MNELVADASAIMAFLAGEPFTLFDHRRLTGAVISTVDLAEVRAGLGEFGMPESEAVIALGTKLALRIVAFDEPQARIAARLRSMTRHAGLSLADRACLALGLRLNLPVVTADRAWAGVEVGAEILMIR